MWKVVNVTLNYKKENKMLAKKITDQYHCFLFLAKFLKKSIFNYLYSYFNSNNLLTKNQSGFRPGDSTINQLLFLVNEIHEAFDNPK